jgi:hypothetical protein
MAGGQAEEGVHGHPAQQGDGHQDPGDPAQDAVQAMGQEQQVEGAGDQAQAGQQLAPLDQVAEQRRIGRGRAGEEGLHPGIRVLLGEAGQGLRQSLHKPAAGLQLLQTAAQPLIAQDDLDEQQPDARHALHRRPPLEGSFRFSL